MHPRVICFCVSDELLQIADRQVLAYDQHDRLLDDQRHRLEIGRGIVERLGVQRLDGGERAEAEAAMRRHISIVEDAYQRLYGR